MSKTTTPERGQPLIYTQVALMGKDISQIQKDLTTLTADVKILTSARFVTQQELELQIVTLKKELADQLNNNKLDIENGLKSFKTIGMTVNTAIILAIVAAIMNFFIKGGFE